MHLNLNLFLTFAKISVSAFGGGYAVMPLLQRDVVKKRQWITSDDLADIFAIAQCTPGVIAVNSATYVGAKVNKGLGAICATLGILSPAILIVTLVATFFMPYFSLPWVQHALMGLQICVCALILQVVIRLFRSFVLDLPSFLIFCASLLISFFTSISPIFLIIAAGLFGFAVYRLRGGKKS